MPSPRKSVEELLQELSAVLDHGQALGSKIARAARIARRADEPMMQGAWIDVTGRCRPCRTRLAEEMDGRGLTPASLGAGVGLRDDYISHYMRGIRAPSLAAALLIARHLDVPVEHLWSLQ